MKTKIVLMLALLALVAGTCGSCASGVFRKELVFHREELQQKIEREFPLETKKSLITASFSAPVVLLAEGSDRMGIGLAVKVVLPGGKKFHGDVEVDGALQYRPENGELFVVNPRVRQLQIAELPERYRGPAQEVVSKMVKHYLSSVLIYQLKQDDFKHSLARLVLKSVRVEEGNLVVEIGL